MSAALRQRLTLVRHALEQSSEPLHQPLGIVFEPVPGDRYLQLWKDHAGRARAGTTFAPASLYVHVPFCARLCTYCLLSAVRVPGREAVSAYVAALRKQIALFEPAVRGLSFVSLHIGGGTPTLLDEGSLDALLTDLSRFSLSPDAQIGVEAHPATSTPRRLAVLRRYGVHRVSFGVESMTPSVLRNVNRTDQTEERVHAAVTEARRLGFSINIDLLAGLPGESVESFRETIDKTLALRPESMSVNRFLIENSALAAIGYVPDVDETRRTDAMLLAADRRIRELAPPRWPEEPLRRPGFGSQYVWDRSDSARRFFQGDMIGPVSTLALGHGAMGHVHGRGFSVAAGTIAEWTAKLADGTPPDMLVAPVDERFEMAFFVTARACRGEFSPATFQRVFGRDVRSAFGPELEFLLQERLLVIRGKRIAKPERRDFQVTHLLAFLARGLEELQQDVASEGLLASDVEAMGLAQRQYQSIQEELTPSMLWSRLAIRASQANRRQITAQPSS